MLKSMGLPALLASTALALLPNPLLAQETEDTRSTSGDPDAANAENDDNAIVVTGTRIRGARVVG